MMTETPEAPRRRLDPAILPILVGAVVLLMALVFLFSRPPVPPPESFDRTSLETRLSAVEDEQRALPSRLAAIEARPMPDAGALARLSERLATLETAASERQAAVDRRLAAAESGTARLDRLADRLGALEAKAETAGAEQERRLAAAEAGASQRIAALEAAFAGRLAALEAGERRLAAAEGRLTRLTAALAVETALDGGRPLGQALAPLGNAAPVALARFASEAPPTEAQLRLAFEEAARKARAAIEPGAGQGVLEAAAARLSGLVTIRRGETVVLGDPAGAALEQAQRALEAGDLPKALAHLDTLPEPAKAAMEGWSARARSLIEARAALRGLAGGN